MILSIQIVFIMATDRDGCPSAIGSKVWFSHVNSHSYEGIVTNESETTITLAEDFKMFKEISSKTQPLSIKLQDIVNLVVVESPKGVTDDMTNFLTSGNYSDIQLKCKDQTFNCHRVLLAGKSPVFDAMLHIDMEEASSGCIEIRNMKPRILNAVLEFIYSNKIETKKLRDDPDFAGDLLAAAEMYDMPRLKQICEDELCDILAVNNVLLLLEAGDTHRATKLKEKALKMIAEKFRDVVKLENWSDFVETYPKLTVEIERCCRFHSKRINFK